MGLAVAGIASFRFAQTFRAAASTEVEFSFGEDPERYGTMVGGGASLFDAAEGFCAGEAFAGEWAWAAKRFVQFVRPDAFLLRADWRRAELESLSLYCRFPREPATDEELEHALRPAAPFRWTGPSARGVAAALGLPGPRGVVFRVDVTGRRHVAIYFRLGRVASTLDPGLVERLVEAVRLPSEVASAVRADTRRLYVGGTAGVVGVAGDRAGHGILKLNPANVPLADGLAFLTAKGVSAARIGQLAETARILRARYITYLGARYDPSGFAGWKVYLAVAPQALAPPAGPRLAVSGSAVPALRLPHY